MRRKWVLRQVKAYLYTVLGLLFVSIGSAEDMGQNKMSPQHRILLKDIDNVTFGPEFAFSIDEFVNFPEMRPKVIARYADLVNERAGIGDFRIRKQNRFKVQSLESFRPILEFDTWSLQVDTDPGVIEVQTSPGTYEDFLSRSPLLQTYLFDLMNEAGVRPQEYRGGGHIHIGPQAFRRDPRLLRDFIVDYYNHGGLAEGGLNFDKQNSGSAAFYSNDAKVKLRGIIDRFDSGKIVLFEDLYNELKTLGKASIRYNDQFKTVEIRAIRPQQSMNDFVKLVKLFRARMRHLSKNKALIELDDLEPTKTSIQALEEFYRYVTAAGLKWDDYRHFVLPHWQNSGADLDVFEERLFAGKLQTKPAKGKCLQDLMRLVLNSFNL